MTTPRYASPAAFRQALETRIHADARARGISFNRQALRFTLERFVVRIEEAFGDG